LYVYVTGKEEPHWWRPLVVSSTWPSTVLYSLSLWWYYIQ